MEEATKGTGVVVAPRASAMSAASRWPKADAAVLLVDEHAVDAEAREFLPDVVGARAAGFGDLPHPFERGAAFEIAADAVLQHPLLFTECEIH